LRPVIPVQLQRRLPVANTETGSDPRHKGFAGFSLRPSARPQAETPEVQPPRRGITGPPPPKPTIPLADLPASRPVRAPALSSAESPIEREPEVQNPASLPPKGGLPKEPSRTRLLGVQRHHMRYVQFQVSPVISDLLTKRAQEEDIVLGEVVMDALRHLQAHPTSASAGRRRRRAGTSARRSILVRPQEAEEIGSMAEQFEYTPSALIRRALEVYLL
jgi:hypothetical protein